MAASVPEHTVVLFSVVLRLYDSENMLVFVDLSQSGGDHHKGKTFLFVS